MTPQQMCDQLRKWQDEEGIEVQAWLSEHWGLWLPADEAMPDCPDDIVWEQLCAFR